MNGLAAITGASSGIGAAYARALAGRSQNLLLIARRRDRLEGLAAALTQQHSIRVETLAADLLSSDDILRVEERLRAAENLDLLVNNAGFGTRGLFYRTDLAGQDEMHRLHVIATMRLTRAALPGMIERNRGGIVNVSSVAGFWQAPGNVSYCATKAWMNSFTQGLAIELAGTNVKAQALCPGYTYSEFHRRAGIASDKIPKSFWTTAEEVVADSLRGLDAGKVFVIPGWRYKLAVFFMKRVPSSVLVPIAKRQQKKLGRIE
jgi:short-subunit dehydrogenase